MIRTETGETDQSLPANLLAPPRDLLDAPLDYIFADHFRQRCVCAHLRRIAAVRQATADEAAALADFLEGDLLLHHADEDEDLFPAVKRRADPDDGLEPVLVRLTSDHEQSAPLVAAIATALRRQRNRADVRITRRCANAMLTYAAREHRHLSIENSIVLVIARKRLTSADLRAMSLAMQARRAEQAGEKIPRHRKKGR